MGGLVCGRLLIWGNAMCLRARIRSFKPPELHFLSFYHNLEVDKDCLVTQLCLFCIVTSLKILASYTLLPLLMYSCKFQLRNSIFIILYKITCVLNDQSCRCAIKQHSFIQWLEKNVAESTGGKTLQESIPPHRLSFLASLLGCITVILKPDNFTFQRMQKKELKTLYPFLYS